MRWNSHTSFAANQAPTSGGLLALCSNVSWSGATKFNSDSADGIYGISSAGAMGLGRTDVEWSKKTLFFDNSAKGNAGALSIFRVQMFRGEGIRASSKTVHYIVEVTLIYFMVMYLGADVRDS